MLNTPTPRRLALLLALAPLLAPLTPAHASPNARATEAAVQQHLGIYLTPPDFRDPTERIEIRRDEAEIWFLRPIPPPARDTALCEGARWLLIGRLDAATGIRQVFATRDALERVTLVFYDITTDVALDREGRYVQKRTPTPHAKFTISRTRAAQLDPLALNNALSGRDCVEAARSLLDTLWSHDG